MSMKTFYKNVAIDYGYALAIAGMAVWTFMIFA